MTDKIQVIKDLSDGNFYNIEEIAKITNSSIDFVRGVLDDPSVTFSSELDGSGCLYIMDIKYDTIVDGEGFRNSVYCAGCNVFCDGCHNKQSWDVTNGRPIALSTLLNELGNSLYDVTFTGGEASIQAKAVGFLAEQLRTVYGKNVWLYSGHTFEELNIPYTPQEYLLSNVDVLVDGKFIKELRDLDLVFKGSANQRIIDVKESIKNNRIVLYS